MARAALTAAESAGGEGVALPITLLSAPGAAAYAGAGWWRALITTARAAHPTISFIDILDCGIFPGPALAALRLGQTQLVLRARAPLFADIAARAATLGAQIFPEAPPALDLATPGAAYHLKTWLQTGAHKGGDTAPALP